MSVSLSELDNRVFIGLEAAQEYLHLNDIHNVVVQRLNVLTSQSRTSDINVLLATSDEFVPDAIPYDITSLIGKSVPKWIECRVDITEGVADRWFPVRAVPLSQLSDYARIGALACSFHGEEPAGDDEQAIQYVSFTYLPPQTCRVRFDRDSQRTALSADILIPDNIAELVVLQAQNSLVPRVQFKLNMDLRRDKELRPIAGGILASLENIRQQNLVDIEPLYAQWKVWAFRDRQAPTSFNLVTPQSEVLYANGRTNTWGGYGGNDY